MYSLDNKSIVSYKYDREISTLTEINVMNVIKEDCILHSTTEFNNGLMKLPLYSVPLTEMLHNATLTFKLDMSRQLLDIMSILHSHQLCINTISSSMFCVEDKKLKLTELRTLTYSIKYRGDISLVSQYINSLFDEDNDIVDCILNSLDNATSCCDSSTLSDIIVISPTPIEDVRDYDRETMKTLVEALKSDMRYDIENDDTGITILLCVLDIAYRLTDMEVDDRIAVGMHIAFKIHHEEALREKCKHMVYVEQEEGRLIGMVTKLRGQLYSPYLKIKALQYDPSSSNISQFIIDVVMNKDQSQMKDIMSSRDRDDYKR